MAKRIFPALVLVAIGALSACSTVQGFGQDVSTAGNVVQREAAQAQY